MPKGSDSWRARTQLFTVSSALALLRCSCDVERALVLEIVETRDGVYPHEAGEPARAHRDVLGKWKAINYYKTILTLSDEDEREAG